MHTDKQLRYEFLGAVADYCPVCRCVRPFAVLQVALDYLIFGVPAGGGRELGHFRQCGACKALLPYRSDTYTGMSHRPVPLATLIGLTNPQVAATAAEDMELAARLAEAPGSLEPEERAHLTISAIQAVAEQVNHCLAQGMYLDRAARVAMLTTGVLFAVSLALALSDRPTQWLHVSFVGLGLAAVTLLHLAQTYPARFVRRHLLPPLARSLAPLNPSVRELDEALVMLRQLDVLRGRLLRAARLHAAIARVRARMPSPRPPPEPESSAS